MKRGKRHGAALLLLAAIGLTLWHFWRYAGEEDPPPVPGLAGTPRPALVPTVSPELLAPSPTEGPELEGSDELVRRLAQGLSERPELAKWLSHPHLIRRFVVAVDQVAQGKSPRKGFAFLEPEEDFSTIERGGRILVDPRTYRRYDVVAAVVASLDVEGAAELYRELEPQVQAAWAELGYPDREFEDTMAQAIRNLLAAPVIEGEIELDPRVVTHEYADNRLEELGPAKKHLLRMGPDNVRTVQAKLREIARALDLEVEGPRSGETP